MKSKLINFLAILLISSFVSCENDLNKPGDYDAVQASWDIFVENWNELNAEGCMAIFFDDAILIPPQLMELNGKVAITEFYESLFAMNRRAEYQHITESINFSREQAIEVGRFSVKWVSNNGDSSTYHARAMIHWEKDRFGDWKIRKLLFNNPPAQQEE